MLTRNSFQIATGTTLGVLLLFGPACAIQPGAFTDSGGQTIHQELLLHSEVKEKKIELFWAKPEGPGPWPVILFIHGHQEGNRVGGKTFVDVGRLRLMVKRGYVAAAVSQPGYGNSDGPPDFCGPFTQEAVLVAIEFLRSKGFVNPNKVALYGFSRGAVVAAMVATRDARLAAVVLVGGAYDLDRTYPTLLPGIAENVRREAGTSSDAIRARSAIYYADKIKSPVLLLHGASDDRFKLKPAQAEAFAEKLLAQGVRVRAKIFPNVGHFIPITEQYNEIDPFLEEHLR